MTTVLDILKKKKKENEAYCFNRARKTDKYDQKTK